MARERMVTRTVDEAEVKVMTLTVSTQEVGNATYKISATIDRHKVLPYIQKNFDTAEVKNVVVTDYTVHEILYGMTEQEFISRAKILPPRTTTTTEE